MGYHGPSSGDARPLPYVAHRLTRRATRAHLDKAGALDALYSARKLAHAFKFIAPL